MKKNTTTRNNAARRARRDTRSWNILVWEAKYYADRWFLKFNPSIEEISEERVFRNLIKSTKTIREKIAMLAVLASGTLEDELVYSLWNQPSTKCCLENVAYVKRQLRKNRGIMIRVYDYDDEGHYQNYRIW